MFTQGYIGVSDNAELRFETHKKRPSNLHIANAINKYGWDNLVKQIIIMAEKSYCLMIESQLRHEKNIGWNIAIGGGNPPDLTGNKYRLGIPSWSKGKKLSDEHKKNLSIAHIGQIAWNKGKKGVQEAWNKGLRMTEKAKQHHTMQVTCPHCNKIGKFAGMRVWHFNNCKQKDQI